MKAWVVMQRINKGNENRPEERGGPGRCCGWPLGTNGTGVNACQIVQFHP